MKVRSYEFDGTAEEFAKTAPFLSGMVPAKEKSEGGIVPTSNPAGQPMNEELTKYVTKQQAVKILTRLPLSKSIATALQALYKASPSKLTSDQLRSVMGLDKDQFRGTMGAFGRRVVHDVDPGVVFFVQEWSGVQFEWGLPPSVREAIEVAKLF